MSLNVRTVDPANSHVVYNKHVKSGERFIESARAGSEFLTADYAIAVASTYLSDIGRYGLTAVDIKSPKLAEIALNWGLRITHQNGLLAAHRRFISKPNQSDVQIAERAASALRDQIPDLFK